MFGRVFWAGVQWTSTIFLVGLLVSSTVDVVLNVLECVKQLEGSVVTINGNCSSTLVTLEVTAKDFEFVMMYAGNAGMQDTSTKLKVGTCSVKGEISAGGDPGPQLSFPVGDALFFPISGKTSANKLNLDGQNKREVSCGESFKQTKSGSLIVPIGLQPTRPLPHLNLIIKNAKIYWGEVEDSGWGIGGWKLWSSIGGGLVIVILIVAVGLVVYWRKKKQEGEELEANPQGNNEGAAKQGKSPKKVPVVNPKSEMTVGMVNAVQGDKPQTSKRKKFEGDDMETAEEDWPPANVEFAWPASNHLDIKHLERMQALIGHVTTKHVFNFLQKYPIRTAEQKEMIRECRVRYQNNTRFTDRMCPRPSYMIDHMMQRVDKVRLRMEATPEWRPRY